MSVVKEDNFKIPVQKHSAKFDAYQGMLRKDKILELSKGLSPQENIYKEVKTQMDSVIKSSYGIAKLIAKIKPFCDGEFVKQCVESMTDTMCPDKTRDFSQIILSHLIIARSTEGIGKPIQKKNREYSC